MKSSLRGSSFLVTGLALAAFAFLVPNCQPSGGDEVPSAGGSGGGSGGSGNGGSGGSNSGGTTSSGGSSSSGGSNSGGTSSSGGSSNSGGSAKGGSGGSNSGGSGGSNSGGTSSSGGSVSSGGTSSAGGTVSSGGTTTTSTGSGNTGTTVTFANGKAAGAMTGYGYVALGKLDTITDPTCGTAKAAITEAASCATTTNWNATDKLCMTGSIPALPAAPTSTDYSDNWGAQVALNAADPAGGGLGQSFSSVTITMTGSPTSGLRAVVHKKGEAASTSYCAALTPGTAIPFTSFVTDCYNTAPSGTKITAADVTNIDKIGVQVSSGSAAITIADLCITKIEFAK